jgi:hypothetical protein
VAENAALIRRLAVGALLVAGLVASCRSTTLSHTVPRPEVHVQVELYPDPPPKGNCCTVVTVNPTNQEVYIRCEVTAYALDGTVVFQGGLIGIPAGIFAPPGRHRWGSGAPRDKAGNSLHLENQRVETQCDAFVWKGQPPV